MTLGNNIKSYRIANGMLQEQLAKAIGVSKQTISSWETDRTEPNIGAIETMSRIFGCSKLDLIGKDYITTHDIKVENKEETLLIENFRTADETTKDIIRRLLAYTDKLKG